MYEDEEEFCKEKKRNIQKKKDYTRSSDHEALDLLKNGEKSTTASESKQTVGSEFKPLTGIEISNSIGTTTENTNEIGFDSELVQRKR
ncbi:hypothetical protein EVAR_21828_1 [Eumeta japonica]|uniref:Uncharacterized protein n=1 Tax=Eumeta variegata TaxID=151549 RepID=A0A4C1VA34_EUMVA|nr:hypothetical protein EVAR_21828_1 [Eumeta japonica]